MPNIMDFDGSIIYVELLGICSICNRSKVPVEDGSCEMCYRASHPEMYPEESDWPELGMGNYD